MFEYMVDLIIVSILLFFAIAGYISGLSGKILSILTWAGSAAIGYFLYPHFSPFLTNYIENDLIRNGVSFAGIFVVFLILFSFLSSQLSGSIKKSKAGKADRNLGLVLGIFIGVSFLMLAASTLHFFFDIKNNAPEPIKKSKLYPYVETCLDKVCQLFPSVSYFNLSRDKTQKTQENAHDTQILSGFSAASKKAKTSEEQGYSLKDRKHLASLLTKVN